MAANGANHREARPRETHLVVTLDRSDLSPDPVRTPAPELPDGIDVLWVLLGYFNAKWTYRLWRTTASDRRWHLLRHPLGKPPPVRPETGRSAPATPTPWPPVTPSRPGPATAGTQQKRAQCENNSSRRDLGHSSRSSPDSECVRLFRKSDPLQKAGEGGYGLSVFVPSGEYPAARMLRHMDRGLARRTASSDPSHGLCR